MLRAGLQRDAEKTKVLLLTKRRIPLELELQVCDSILMLLSKTMLISKEYWMLIGRSVLHTMLSKLQETAELWTQTHKAVDGKECRNKGKLKRASHGRGGGARFPSSTH